MDIRVTANEYKQIISQKEAETEAMNVKYAMILQPYHQDVALMAYLEGKDKFIFEGWQIEKKRKFLASLNKHKTNYHIEHRGEYEVVVVHW
jgi:hypothetical protein